MKIFAIKFSHTVIRYRLLFVLVFIAISLFFLYCLRDITFQTNIDDFYPQKHPFVNVQSSSSYWSSTTHEGDTRDAWSVYMGNGHVHNEDKPDSYCVWPVRGGQ